MKNSLKILGVVLCILLAVFLTACGGGGGGNGGGSTSPSIPTGVIATAGNGQVTINWDAVAYATSYNIYYSTTSGVTTTTGIKIANATSPYIHPGLTNGITYYYVVTAVNNYGESRESTDISAKPINTSIVCKIIKHDQSSTLPYSYYYYIPNSSISNPIVAIVLSAIAGLILLLIILKWKNKLSQILIICYHIQSHQDSFPKFE